jgi:hypothetical protein
MGTAAWVIPVSALGSLILVCLAGVWWYIPRLYTKGIREDMARVAAEKAARAHAAAERQANGGEDIDLESGELDHKMPEAAAKPVFKYTPTTVAGY